MQELQVLSSVCHTAVERRTWDSGMMWLASSWMGKARPSSEAKEDMGERVPEVRMMERAHIISEKAWKWEGTMEGQDAGGRGCGLPLRD